MKIACLVIVRLLPFLSGCATTTQSRDASVLPDEQEKMPPQCEGEKWDACR
jgi:hypothetical protein